MRKRKTRYAVGALLAVTVFATVAYAVTYTDVRTDNRVELSNGNPCGGACFSSSTSNGTLYETFIVPSGSQAISSSLDPRVERVNDRRIDADQTISYTFTASYTVRSAKRTTVAQILNVDNSSSDGTKPVLFLIANRGTDGKVTLSQGHLSSSNNGFWKGDNVFSLKIVTNGRKADVFVDNVKEHTQTFERTGDHSYMRYGAYHHDTNSNGVANSKAEIVARNAKLVS